MVTGEDNFKDTTDVVTRGISSRNEIHDSSICCSIHPTSSYVVSHWYWKIVVKQTNFSSNWCKQYSAVSLNPSSNGDNVAASISYSSIANNVASDGYCVGFGSSYLYEIESCNFLSNTDQSSNNGLITVSGSLNLRNSCILNNSDKYIIYNVNGYST